MWCVNLLREQGILLHLGPSPAASQREGRREGTCLCEPWFASLCNEGGASQPHRVMGSVEKYIQH